MDIQWIPFGVYLTLFPTLELEEAGLSVNPQSRRGGIRSVGLQGYALLLAGVRYYHNRNITDGVSMSMDHKVR
ncbi:predicted protein [Sclerotinia sclerotiorum 1980 UF-70]|uniref:Uncharacterized protein n=1 Tax=Sclerotinia sclerotiorum (strain ATCC 18683 / 1980 / Ss-1) TaxID=665079 RepID=A7EG67_SCLS1|nr:predicted protein [Sclerotinia sclerotiorum 1980 UF-70]EDO01833.1 predicted protein [Sclerotinia sclerotiorum 1980 UF-70]